jgi:hypothetical protein
MTYTDLYTELTSNGLSTSEIVNLMNICKQDESFNDLQNHIHRTCENILKMERSNNPSQLQQRIIKSEQQHLNESCETRLRYFL